MQLLKYPGLGARKRNRRLCLFCDRVAAHAISPEQGCKFLGSYRLTGAAWRRQECLPWAQNSSLRWLQNQKQPGVVQLARIFHATIFAGRYTSG